MGGPTLARRCPLEHTSIPFTESKPYLFHLLVLAESHIKFPSLRGNSLLCKFWLTFSWCNGAHKGAMAPQGFCLQVRVCGDHGFRESMEPNPFQNLKFFFVAARSHELDPCRSSLNRIQWRKVRTAL